VFAILFCTNSISVFGVLLTARREFRGGKSNSCSSVVWFNIQWTRLDRLPILLCFHSENCVWNFSLARLIYDCHHFVIFRSFFTFIWRNARAYEENFNTAVQRNHNNNKTKTCNTTQFPINNTNRAHCFGQTENFPSPNNSRRYLQRLLLMTRVADGLEGWFESFCMQISAKFLGRRLSNAQSQNILHFWVLIRECLRIASRCVWEIRGNGQCHIPAILLDHKNSVTLRSPNRGEHSNCVHKNR
jgi:hypothetical protein